MKMRINGRVIAVTASEPRTPADLSSGKRQEGSFLKPSEGAGADHSFFGNSVPRAMKGDKASLHVVIVTRVLGNRQTHSGATPLLSRN